MVIDLNLENLFLSAAAITDNPIIAAIPIAYKTALIACPSSLPYELPKILTDEEKDIVERIKSVVDRVSKDLEISCKAPISVHIATRFAKDSCILGSTRSIEGPILLLSSTYLKSFKNHEEEAKWSSELTCLPDDPIELAKKLETLSEERLSKLKELANAFLHIPSEDELTSVIAHELGNAKRNHSLKEQGLYALALLANRVAIAISTHFGFQLLYSALSIPLTYLCTKVILKHIETEADRSCSPSYQKGMIDFHKKRLIAGLLNGSSKKYEQITRGMLSSWDLFSDLPNSAKRLYTTVHPPQKKGNLTPPEGTLSLLGIGNIARQALEHSLSILSYISAAV